MNKANDKQTFSSLEVILLLVFLFLILVTIFSVRNRMNYQRFIAGGMKKPVDSTSNPKDFPVLVLCKDKRTGNMSPGIVFYETALTALLEPDKFSVMIPVDKLGIINKELITGSVGFPLSSRKGTVEVQPLSERRQLIRVTYQLHGGTYNYSGWYITDGKSISPIYRSRYTRWNLIGILIPSIIVSIILSLIILPLLSYLRTRRMGV